MLFYKRESMSEEYIKDQAAKLNMSLQELGNLYINKSCPKYGLKEPLHVRKVRGGKYVVFNISERYRSEKISEGRKKTTALTLHADIVANEND